MGTGEKQAKKKWYKREPATDYKRIRTGILAVNRVRPELCNEIWEATCFCTLCRGQTTNELEPLVVTSYSFLAPTAEFYVF